MDNQVIRKEIVISAINKGNVDVLKAYLAGEEIQVKYEYDKVWEDIQEPEFLSYNHYRIKPEEPKTLDITIFRNTRTKELSAVPDYSQGPWELVDSLQYELKE